ncbi:hypothetical protein QN277_011714 [Acacia crassicarpa]|uniref:Uncharacterized protein n=1 Tax=Acacia crassicarpa TaxID=499986 RepID=A0AAE1MZY6_9FABA|nr:hypothetical protein QN277_011714 [Acacia crassicarpa]
MAFSISSSLKTTKPLSFFLKSRRKSYLRWPTPYATLPPPVPGIPFYKPGSDTVPSSPPDKVANPPPTDPEPSDSNWPTKSYLRWPTPYAILPPPVPLDPFHPGYDTVPSATTSPEPSDSNSKPEPEPEDSNSKLEPEDSKQT